MALDPRISLGVQPMQMPDPMAQYGKVAAIQQAQNQNALAQYQLGAAQRAEEKDIARTNALALAGNDDTAIANALLKAGDLAGYTAFVKSSREANKAQVELVDAKLKQSRSFLDTIDPNDANAPQQYLAWHQANHADPVLGPVLKARGVTAEQAFARINDAIQKGPQAFAELLAQSKLGTEKFMELNKPHWVNAGGATVPVSGLTGQKLTGVPTIQDIPLPAPVEEQKRRIAAAGKPVTNVNVSTEKRYGEEFGKRIAEADVGKMAAAEAAPKLAASADRILELVSSGKVITGAGADARLQLAKALKVAGVSDDERIANTEVLVSTLAGQTMGAIKSSGLGAGQGFTDADRDFLQSMVGKPNYDNKSLARLADLSRRTAEASAQEWNKRVRQIPSSSLQGTGISTEPIIVPKRAGSQKAGAAPAGVDPALWNAMTPQERALWK